MLLAIVALFVVVAGFGDAWTELGVHEPLFVVVFYLPVAFVVLFVALTIARRLVVGSPFPFEPGRYLFPTDFVDARNATLRIVPTRFQRPRGRFRFRLGRHNTVPELDRIP